ncbi:MULTISPECIES: formyltetrahydrofolate deformylase [Cycloclasticus]|uniref:Formyltetrahydrofolate deformylase n=1 Tax=Cycloclasticus pugetii TaxID=34068 RepID=A0AB33Z1D2_9GAMM|nr:MULTISPECIES: formyltetrahydrofolate deformylase [Cycloclasticus]ATI02537.1 formyltetrahydrofolate deformylase [Cycloclasticus sp. PY97N]EPD13002.1 formyltetrahydrofolate deformylase [Cycloclasticus pugetii]SHI63480.1 formyltetrahydrofolate deformylase [Cycloclasticus pugetii]
MNQQTTAILLAECPDQAGIIAKVTNFLTKNNGNIVDLEQHVDTADKHFFMRVEWQLENFSIDREQIQKTFSEEVGSALNMNWQIAFSDIKPRLALFVSQHGHCLFDILSRYQSGEWDVEIPLVISNHKNHQSLAENAGIAFHHIPITADNKQQQEQAQLDLLAKHQIDTIVLARYMQILSANFIDHYPHQIINIHHSFLPAFPGARPYHSAHERGVKIIGATSHYVTTELDAGPIIEQDIVRIRHNDNIEDLKRKGQDNEKIVLSRAIRHHLMHKVLVYKNRCIVFV